jgi:adenine phosphoribosyltransferase
MGIESRGFFWGLLIAQHLNIPFIPVRKKGKLPYKTVSQKYDLEYGSAEIEVHQDSIVPGSRILIHDDLLATGGTAVAAANIVEKEKAKVAGFSFLVILDFLKGEQKLTDFSSNIKGLVHY